MTELFTGIDAKSASIARGLWSRRAVLTVLLVVPILALLNVFGQQPTTEATTAPAARLSLEAPEALRGGLLFQSKITVVATRAIAQPRLVLGNGWIEGMQVNSIEPGAESEGSQDGHIRLAYGQLAAGQSLVVWVHSQVEPTDPGHRDYGVTLQDGGTPIASIHRFMTTYP